MPKTIKTVLIGLIAVVAIIGILFKLNPIFSEKKLSKDEINELRITNSFTVFSDESVTASIKDVSLREFGTLMDTFAYCELIGAPEYKEVFISTGNEELDRIKKERLSELPVMTIYNVKVLKDSEGLFEEGTITNFCYGLAFQGNSPEPKEGERIIIPVKLGSVGSVADIYSSYFGYYYITDDGYGISAFEEDGVTAYSGKKVDNLLKSLRKTDAERNAYLAEKKEMYERSSGEYGFDSIEMLREQIKERIALRNSNAEK